MEPKIQLWALSVFNGWRCTNKYLLDEGHAELPSSGSSAVIFVFNCFLASRISAPVDFLYLYLLRDLHCWYFTVLFVFDVRCPGLWTSKAPHVSLVIPVTPGQMHFLLYRIKEITFDIHISRKKKQTHWLLLWVTQTHFSLNKMKRQHPSRLWCENLSVAH